MCPGRLCLYGPNSINVPVKPYHVLFIEEVLHPFYIFQLLSISLWMYEHYYSYAGIIDSAGGNCVFGGGREEVCQWRGKVHTGGE